MTADNGASCLMIRATKGHLDVVTALLEAGGRALVMKAGLAVGSAELRLRRPQYGYGCFSVRECVRACVRVCVRACVRACVICMCACVRACMHACAHAPYHANALRMTLACSSTMFPGSNRECAVHTQHTTQGETRVY
jgi:hypothetical protein